MVSKYIIPLNDILSNPANFTPPTRANLFHAASCKAVVASAYIMKSAEFLPECSRAKCLLSQSSKLNELILTQSSTIVCA